MVTTIRHYVVFLLARFFRILSLAIPRRVSKSIMKVLLKTTQYRRATVYGNLRASFPTLSDDAIATIASQFYEHLTDVTIDQLTASGPQRVRIHNKELIDKLLSQYRHIIVLGSHYGYWETVGKALTPHIPTPHQYVAYRQIRNPYLNEYVRELRSDTLATPIDQKKIYRKILQHLNSKQPSAYYLIADQYPSSLQNIETTVFLHQETRWINSAKRIATKFNLPVVYLQWDGLDNGEHAATIVPIYDPSRPTTTSIIASYAKYLQGQIEADPAKWLWSHKRWKNIRKET